MKILMKDYRLDAFNDKDVFEWEEIVDRIIELEEENYMLREKLEKLTREPEDKETWEYDRGE